MDWFKTTKDDLRYALNCVRNVVDRRDASPPWRQIKLETVSGMIRVTGTDLKTAVRVWLTDAPTAKDASCLVEYKQLAGAVSKLKKGNVTFTIDIPDGAPGGSVTISQGSGQRKIEVLALTGYPDVHEWFQEPGDYVPCISADDLHSMMNLVAPSICKDETRYSLCAVFLEGDGDVLRAVTADGHRLHVAERECLRAESQIQKSGLLLPAPFVHTVIDALKKRTGEVTIEKTERGVMLTLRGQSRVIEIVTCIEDAQFPKWRQVWPNGYAHTIEIDRAWLAEQAKAIVQQFGKEEGIRFELENGVIHLLAEDPGSGEFRATHPVTYSRDEDLAPFGLRSSYVLDAVKHLPDESVKIRLLDTRSPIVFGELDDRCLVMPVILD